MATIRYCIQNCHHGTYQIIDLKRRCSILKSTANDAPHNKEVITEVVNLLNNNQFHDH